MATQSPKTLRAVRAAAPGRNKMASAPGVDAAALADPGFIADYMIDACQRTILFWDVIRRRGDQYFDQQAKAVPNVLQFQVELVVDGRTLARPVNYGLVRVIAPPGVAIDPARRPFVVIDPRAGHGPGIGGFKSDSEIGVAMRAGHPCYFIGFTPQPQPGQTLEDIMHAEAIFMEKVVALHPNTQGKPCVIGNCQAGWAAMMVAATRPELFGPVILAGSPLSYWAGREGANPMRYTGGIAGGSWMTALAGDLGKGTFDGGHLVSNFENLNPANTNWTKDYNLWSKVDTEGERFLEFEKWWGAHVNLNAEEIQWIVDQLFIGNKLATAEIVTSDGVRIDLRNIRSPIICFCSKGDNITPPEQALGWIVDLYASDDEILACAQTIVYAIHESVGHLGIFVSGGVARKEHQEFASNIDLIDVLPPGIYEAVMTPKTVDMANAELVAGDWLVRFERRTLENVRAIVRPNAESDRRFATVRQISEVNLAMYRLLLQPLVRSCVTDEYAKWLRVMNPSRENYEVLSSHNPAMEQVAALAETVREQRRPVSPDNPLVQMQGAVSDGIIAAWDAWRDWRDSNIETVFNAIYGSPVLQAMVGIQPDGETPRRKPGVERERMEFIQRRVRELKAKIPEGGPREAAIRGLAYVGMGGTGVDERAFNELRSLRDSNKGMTLVQFKQVLREQFFMLLLDEDAALAAIPAMLQRGGAEAGRLLVALQKTIHAVGTPEGAKAQRLARVEQLFAREQEPKNRKGAKDVSPGRKRSAS